MADDLSARVLSGDKSAVAAALNLVEDTRPRAHERVAALLGDLSAASAASNTSAGHRIGITGPPGVGKSTLAAALARSLRHRGTSVGVVAVDPSSVHSGGALLGDRARMSFDPADAGLFVRSLATGGESGGLSWAANAAVRVLGAAYDVVIVETTGVGQSETDVVHVADTVALVVQPGSGDALQFLKAGIMEIPDVLVVNKADLGDVAKRAATDLHVALGALGAAGAGDPRVPIIETSATAGTGIDELVVALDHHRDELGEEGVKGRRRRGTAAWARALFARRYGELGFETLGGEAAFDTLLGKALDRGIGAPDAAAELGRQVLSGLQKG